MCIVVNLEHIFTKYDLSQNIPIKAGDIVLLKKYPLCLGVSLNFGGIKSFHGSTKLMSS